MSRVNPLQSAFNAGEFGPRLAARVDFDKYRNAGSRVENMLPLPQGGLMRRPGSRYIAAVADSTKRGRLIPFEHSTEQAYVIEAGDGQFRFFRNKGQITVAETDAAISNGDFDTDLTDWDDESTGSTEILLGAATLTIGRSLGTAIGDMTGNGGLAAAFDGTTSQTGSACAVKNSATSASVGKNWGAGNKKTVNGFTIYGSSSIGFLDGSAGNVTFTLQGSSDNFSSDVNDLGSVVAADSGGANLSISKTSGIDTSTAYQYHRVLLSHSLGDRQMLVAELEWTEIQPNPLEGMQLVGDGSSIAWAQQDVTTTDTDQEHVLAFRVLGTQGRKVSLSIGTTDNGGELISDIEYGIGWHVVAFTPTVGTFYVQFKNPNNYTVAVDDVSILASGEDDDVPLSLTVPYQEEDLPDLRWSQSADVIYFTHPDYPPYKLERRGHTTWSLVRVAFDDGPYLPQNATATTLTLGATSGDDVTLTASSATGINNDEGFSEDDVGRLVRFAPSGEPGWAVITYVQSSTAALVDIMRSPASATATAKWSLGAWSDATGWPAVVTFFEQRTVWANTTGQPQTFWMSQSGDLENMRPDSYEDNTVEVQDDDGLDFTIASDQVNAIGWMSPGRQLLLGTSGGEWSVTSDGPVVIPSDIDVKRESTNGSADIQPIRISSIVLFIQRAKRKLRELVFSFETDGFRAPDLTILADHITKGGLREIAYKQEPDSLVYCVREDGVLPVLTYRREEDVVGWSRTIMGGAFGSDEPVVESVAVIPGNSTTGTEGADECWLIVKRTINSATARYIEVFEEPFEGPNPDDYDNEVDFRAAVLAAQKEAFYLDSGLIYDGSSTSTLTGLDHLEGETVGVWGNGAVMADKVVSSGSIALESAVTYAVVGLRYRHVFKSLKLAFGAQAGTAVGKVKRVHKATAVLLHSLGLRFGRSIAELRSIPLPSAPTLFTGEHTFDHEGEYDTDPRIVIAGDDPAPLHILALAPELKTNEML